MPRSVLSIGLAVAAAALSAVDADTTVAVLEFGKGGAVRRTTSSTAGASVEGVASFFNAVHDIKPRRGLLHANLPVVPDLFNRADGGVAIGLSGGAVDLASMPAVSALLEDSAPGIVGRFEVSGSRGEDVFRRASSEPTAAADAASFGSALNEAARSAVEKESSNSLEAVSVRVDTDAAAAEADTHVSRFLRDIQKRATESGSTVVVHLVVEEGEGASRRRLASRRLEDRDEDEDREEEDNKDEEEDRDEEGEGQEGQNGNNANGNNANANGNAGYGYVNSAGVWVSAERSIFQIQYFNITLWTAVGMVVIVLMAIGMTIYMPLEADTLLFGESAKMMGE